MSRWSSSRPSRDARASARRGVVQMVIVPDGAVTAAVTRLSAGPMSAGLSAADAGLRQVRESGGVIGAAPVVDGMPPVMVTGAAAGGGGELELAGARGLAARRGRG